ncbi:MAG: NSS family neurotransmitter:Na+ symporter [Oleispira sp.]|jgi:NSS family neurotransmitter:Na+ symporter
MSEQKRGMHGIWGGRWTFILAATGSAVGLGNLWKFPYITGENGGGAFVLVYLACILLAGIPVMLAEVLLGRKERMSPINTMAAMTDETGAPKFFRGIGWMGALSGFFILSFYSVIAGWALVYVGKIASGAFAGIDADGSGAAFGAMLADPVGLTIWHTVFMVLTGAVIARGVNKGLEATLNILMPILFVLMLILFGYSLTTPGFMQGFHFLFDFDFSKLTTESIVVALGHSFFTLSLGMGAIMAYGAYMPSKQSLGKTILWVGLLDTIVALVAGMIIFAIVFSNGLEPSSGPGLMFISLPIAFGGMPGGVFFGTVFFILVSIAAWSSAISIAEPAVAWAVEKGITRVKATLGICGFAWVLGLGTVLSFNEWAEYKVFGKTFFDSLDFITSNVMLPLGGLFIAVFVGWFMSSDIIRKEMKMKNETVFTVWRFVLRFISPVAISLIFINGLGLL